MTKYKYYLLVLYGKTTFKFEECNKFYNGWIIYLIDNNIQHIDQSDESREKLACQKNKIAPSYYFIEMYISSHWVDHGFTFIVKSSIKFHGLIMFWIKPWNNPMLTFLPDTDLCWHCLGESLRSLLVKSHRLSAPCILGLGSRSIACGAIHSC